jgi:hypothetical protein
MLIPFEERHRRDDVADLSRAARQSILAVDARGRNQCGPGGLFESRSSFPTPGGESRRRSSRRRRLSPAFLYAPKETHRLLAGFRSSWAIHKMSGRKPPRQPYPPTRRLFFMRRVRPLYEPSRARRALSAASSFRCFRSRRARVVRVVRPGASHSA